MKIYLHFQQHDADMSVAAVPYIVKIPYGIFNLNGREIKGVDGKLLIIIMPMLAFI